MREFTCKECGKPFRGVTTTYGRCVICQNRWYEANHYIIIADERWDREREIGNLRPETLARLEAKRRGEPMPSYKVKQ